MLLLLSFACQGRSLTAPLARLRGLRMAGGRALRPPPHMTDGDYDVAVVGGGPAGYTVAALTAREGLSVALIDPDPERSWPNNYGAWRTEWEALAQRLQIPELLDCVNVNWEVTDCFFGGSFDMPFEQRTRLDRAYLQVDRGKFKECMQALHAANDVHVLQGSVQANTISPNLFDANLSHDATGSSITISPSGATVKARVVVDATGFESTLVARESPTAAGFWKEQLPGYQIAYGMTVDVSNGDISPYAGEAMTLFDYRTDHLVGTDLLEDAEQRPSFVYVMPQGKSAFFEETSLVGRDERRLEFEVCLVLTPSLQRDEFGVFACTRASNTPHRTRIRTI